MAHGASLPITVKTFPRRLLLLALAGTVGGGVFLAKRFIAESEVSSAAAFAHHHTAVSSTAVERTASDVGASGAPDVKPASGTLNARSSYNRAALDELFEQALTNRNAEERRTLIRGIAEFLAENDVAKAGEFIEILLGARGRSGDADAYAFTQEFVLKLAPRDAKRAISWADALPEGLKDVSYQLVARCWVRSDPSAVADWAATVEHPGIRATVIRAIGLELQHSDPHGLGPRWAADLAQTPDGPRFSDLVAAQWAKSSLPAAAAWVAALPRSDDRERGQVALGTAISETDPVAAIAWGSSLPVGEVRNRIVVEAVGRWASIDPAAAAAWAEQDRSVPGLIETVFPRLAAAWLLRDPTTAARWIEKAPVNPQTKRYVSALSSRGTTPP